MSSWGPPAHPSWFTPPPCSFTDPYYAQPTAHSLHSYAQPQPQWNAPYQGWRPQYNSHPTHFPPPPTQPQPSPPPPPTQPHMPTQPQTHPHPSQKYTPTQLPVPPFPRPYNGAAQPNCEAYKKAKLISEEDPKAGNMSMRPTSIHISIPHPFHHFFHLIVLLLWKLCFLQEVLNLYRKHPIEPLDEPNSILKGNMMVGICWLGLQAPLCPSLAFLHHFSTSFFFYIVLLQEVPVEIVGS